MCVSASGRNLFPSVLLQPLGHLSVSLESIVYGLVVEPGNPNCVANCVRPLNVARSLTAIAKPHETIAPSAGASQYKPPSACLNRRLERF